MLREYADVLFEVKGNKWDGTATEEEMQETIKLIEERFGDIKELDEIDIFCEDFGYNWLDYTK